MEERGSATMNGYRYVARVILREVAGSMAITNARSYL